MSDSRKISALKFRDGEKVYTLGLHPPALSVDGRRIEQVGNGSDRKLQENQLKVLRYLLERPNQYHAPADIAAGAALDAKNPTEALRTHLHYLRAALGDTGRMQLIRTRPARQRGGAAAYGLFAEVEPVAVRAWKSPRRAAGAALLVVGLVCLFFFIREGWFRREPPQRQITTNSPDRPVKAIALSPDNSYLAYAEKTGEGEKTDCILRRLNGGENISLPVLRDSEIFRLSWLDSATLLVSGKLGRDETHGVWLVPILASAAPPVKVPVNQNEATEAAALDMSHIAFIGGDRDEIWLTGLSGEQPRRVLSGEPGDEFGGLTWLAGGRLLLFNRVHLAGAVYRITFEALNPESGQTSVVINNNPRLRAGCASPRGHIFYSLEREPPDHNDNSIWEMSIDPSTGAVTREAMPVAASTGSTVHGLSTDEAGEHLVLLKGPYQADVWVGDVDETSHTLSATRRLTHDDSNDLPTAWTPDGGSVLFHSNRGGKYAIYRQGLNSTEAERITFGNEDCRGARTSPDGERLFYLSRREDWQHNKTDSLRLKVSSIDGANPQLVYDRYALFSVRCARAPSSLCVLGQRDILNWLAAGELVFRDLSRLDKEHNELGGVGGLPLGQEYWDVSPDGTQIAVVAGGESNAVIKILGLDGASSEVIVSGRVGLQSLDWTADGKGWYVSSRSARSADLLYVDPGGGNRVIWKSPDGFETWGVPSPDGEHLAILEWTVTGNVWLIDEPPKRSNLSPTLLAFIAVTTGIGGLTLFLWRWLSVPARGLNRRSRPARN